MAMTQLAVALGTANINICVHRKERRGGRSEILQDSLARVGEPCNSSVKE